MIAIVNVGPHGDPDKLGVRTYEVRINAEVICTFRHRRADGLGRCLLEASQAVTCAALKNANAAGQARAVASRPEPVCSAIPCDTCVKMDWKRMYCTHLQHPIEHGYAMKCHSKACGGYTPNNSSSLGATAP